MRFSKLLVSQILFFLSAIFAVSASAQQADIKCSQLFVLEENLHGGVLDFLRTLRSKPYSKISVAPGASDRFKQLALAGKLISQTDPRLKERDLILPAGGGLCGPTCGVNILHALFSYSNEPTNDFQEQPDRFIQHITSKIMTTFYKDARYGIFSHQLLPILSGIVGKITGNPYNLRGSHKSVFRGDDLLLDSFQIDSNSLTAATVTTGPGKGHYIVILNFDTTTKTLVYADPNYPNKLYSTRWVVSTYKGHKTINMAWYKQTYAQNGWVDSVTKMNLAIPPPPSNNIEP